MTQTMAAFLKHLEALKRGAADDDRAKEERRAAFDEWRRELATLFDRLHEWLREPEASKLVVVLRESTSITEEPFGTYDAPSMIIQMPGGRSVHVHPIALDVLGSKGRVDLTSGPRKARILRTEPNAWLFATQGSRSRAVWDMLPFSQDSFVQVLESLIV